MIQSKVTNQAEGVTDEDLDEITRMILDIKELKQELGKLVVTLSTQAEKQSSSSNLFESLKSK